MLTLLFALALIASTVWLFRRHNAAIPLDERDLMFGPPPIPAAARRPHMMR